MWADLENRDLEEVVCRLSTFIQGGSKHTGSDDKNDDVLPSKLTAYNINNESFTPSRLTLKKERMVAYVAQLRIRCGTEHDTCKD